MGRVRRFHADQRCTARVSDPKGSRHAVSLSAASSGPVSYVHCRACDPLSRSLAVALNFKISTAARNAACDAIVDLIDAGGAGTLAIRTGAPPTNPSDAD